MEYYAKNYASLMDAINDLKENDILYLENKVYTEKIVIDKPNITLIGNDSTIAYNDYAQKEIPLELGGDGKKTFGTTGSATTKVLATASGFKAYNITFMNSFKRHILPEAQAVAIKCEASNMFFESCRFIGEQDTLYLEKGTNNKIINSYIEGDIDFIFGSADCEFINCDIHAIQIKRTAYFVAPATLNENKYGFVFDNCRFKADYGLWASLGRAWYPSKHKETATPRVTVKNSSIDGNVTMTLNQMHPNDPRRFEIHINNTLVEGKCVNIDIVKND